MKDHLSSERLREFMMGGELTEDETEHLLSRQCEECIDLLDWINQQESAGNIGLDHNDDQDIPA